MNFRTLSVRTLSARSFFKPLACAALILAALPMLSAAQAGESHEHKEAVAAHTTPLGLAGYSPVSYFGDGGPHFGSPGISAEHEGVVYFFATEAERDQFNGSPERYVPAYNGWCATGMALGKYFPVDATNYKIVNNRLMLFLNNGETDALKLWNDGDQAEQLGKADAFFKAESMK